MDQSKVYSQQRYTDKSPWTSASILIMKDRAVKQVQGGNGTSE
jgi:hypothetical protein